jgi:hypothetical protein
LHNLPELLENFIHAPHALDGRELKPFCALHYLWLSYLESPFIQTAKEIMQADVSIAALVCSSSSSEEIVRRLERENNRWKISRFVRQLFRSPDSIPAATRKFLAYQSDFLSLPEYQEAKENAENPERIPWLFSIIASVVKETGWPEEYVLTIPLGKLLWYQSTFAFLATGKSNILSGREKEALEKIRKLTARA